MKLITNAKKLPWRAQRFLRQQVAKVIKSQQNKITYYFADFQLVLTIQFAAVLCILNVVYKWSFINQSSAEINFQMKNKGGFPPGDIFRADCLFTNFLHFDWLAYFSARKKTEKLKWFLL